MISIVFSGVLWLRYPLPSFGRVLVKICVACFGSILVKICAAWLWFQNRIQSLAGSFCDFGNPTSHPKSGWFLKSQAALKIWRAHYVILQIQNRIPNLAGSFVDFWNPNSHPKSGGPHYVIIYFLSRYVWLSTGQCALLDQQSDFLSVFRKICFCIGCPSKTKK